MGDFRTFEKITCLHAFELLVPCAHMAQTHIRNTHSPDQFAVQSCSFNRYQCIRSPEVWSKTCTHTHRRFVIPSVLALARLHSENSKNAWLHDLHHVINSCSLLKPELSYTMVLQLKYNAAVCSC